MNTDLLNKYLQSPSVENFEELQSDEETVLWIDWREEDEGIVHACENILQTGSLSAATEDADNESGFELFIYYQDKTVKVPLVEGPEDRHITLVTLNQVLSPDYEVRLIVDSVGADTLAFLPLPSNVWSELEGKFGDVVRKKFYKLQVEPNVFTDKLKL